MSSLTTSSAGEGVYMTVLMWIVSNRCTVGARNTSISLHPLLTNSATLLFLFADLDFFEQAKTQTESGLMKRMVSYRTVSLSQTEICSRIHPMALRNQSPASLISELKTLSPQWPYVHIPTRSHGLQVTSALFQRLELQVSNTEPHMRAKAVPEDCVITLSVANVSKTIKQVNIHKALGPDVLLGRVLGACADQLASVFTDIFTLSLTQSVIPTCFNQIPTFAVLKNSKVTCLNDYRR